MTRPTKEEAIALRKKYPRKQLPIIPCIFCGRKVCTEKLPFCSSECQKKGKFQ